MGAYFIIIRDDNEKYQKLLEKIGVVLGTYNEERRLYENCNIPEKSFDALEKYWGKIFWASETRGETEEEIYGNHRKK
jgi:hypothetical protein